MSQEESRTNVEVKCIPAFQKHLIASSRDNHAMKRQVVTSVFLHVSFLVCCPDLVCLAFQESFLPAELSGCQLSGELFEDSAHLVGFAQFFLRDGADAASTMRFTLDDASGLKFPQSFADRRLACIKFPRQLQLLQPMSGWVMPINDPLKDQGPQSG